MVMNILQQEDLIKGAPDDVLLQEAQAPSGIMPQFLVISEIQRRQDMRQRFAAEEEQPQQTVAEQIVSESSPQQQGIAALPPQMPPQAPVGAMPPQMPPSNDGWWRANSKCDHRGCCKVQPRESLRCKSYAAGGNAECD